MYISRISQCNINAFIYFTLLQFVCMIFINSSCVHGVRIWSNASRNRTFKISRPDILDNYGKHSTIQLEDIKLHYVESGERSKPLMLFVHGFPEFWFSWRHQIEHFAKTHWVVALDTRGYGDSEKPLAFSKYSKESLQLDIVQVIEALGRKDCILVAHDLGGPIAWAVAANYPQVVKKLIILNGPHPTALLKLIKTSPIQFIKSLYILIFQIHGLPEAGARKLVDNIPFEVIRRLMGLAFGKPFTPEEFQAHLYPYAQKDAITPPLNYYRNAFRSLLLDARKQETALPKIRVPTMIIWGMIDPFLDNRLPELTRPYVENLRVEFIPNGNHFVQIHKPKEVNRLIDSFIQSDANETNSTQFQTRM